MRDQDDGTRVLYQLSSMIINILGSPPLPIPFPSPAALYGATAASSSSVSPRRPPQPSPLGFAGLFIAISMAMMLFGSAIFVIGLMLMPLVTALVMLFYLARVVSTLSYLASALLFASGQIVSGFEFLALFIYVFFMLPMKV
ncbi:hypothetical protein SSX86_018837 [Deinandra increscens subsp. villosa]|uniref:Uncharacterized protein n=1 Tax=Deinandra increscens subsp. villosa TaxID=3103831 RepID=A0AAP0CRM3_9ASTR